MPSVVIVTEQCYLLAEAINFIVINEDEEGRDDREYMLDRPKKSAKKKKPTQAQRNKDVREYIQERKPFVIVINFIAKGNPQSGSSPQMKHSSSENSGVHIKVMGLRRTMKVFRDVVKQLREQIPDEKFLDTLVEEFLAGTEDDDKTIDKMELR